MPEQQFPSFMTWFRHSAPYIRAHRGKTFIISFGGEAVESPEFSNLIQDIALLQSLGIRLILIHGARPQIQACLHSNQKIATNELRITNKNALECVKSAAGSVRVHIEGLLSMGLMNSSMAGARINVLSGNFVIAKPIGVKDGVDYKHTGKVRRIDLTAIKQCLDTGAIVLIPPLGYSPTGEVFNLSANEVAMRTAESLKADKLICLLEEEFELPEQLSVDEVKNWLKNHPQPNCIQQHLKFALEISHQVDRIHLLDRRESGGLIAELFTAKGIGTLISKTPYGQPRHATINDIEQINQLINPLVKKGILVARSEQQLLDDLSHFKVISHNQQIIACAAQYIYRHEKMMELACLVVDPAYKNQALGQQLLADIEQHARQQHINQLFVLTTVTSHWFHERGFEPSKIEDLPLNKQNLYNYQRNSLIFIKKLDSS